jgi:putative DNA primase/helicase
MVTERLIVVAREHSYNPVADYLRGLTWDGTERLDDWMMRFLRASVINDATGESVSNWMRLVGRRWLISMAARALSPGCQVDTVPILEGSQGCGKTSTLRILGGRWHTDTKITLGDKDSYMVAGSNWVVELAEIGALKRGDMETIKAFLTAREDSYRMPYGRAVGKHPRMSVIIGTTNDVDNYLLDPTGNRRYWPIKIGLVDRDGLEAARDQLFAEAVAAYDAGERWHMDSVEATAFESAVTSSRVASDDPYVEIIREWWPRSGIKLGFVTTLEVALRCLGIPRDRVTRQDSMRIGAALRAGGWKRRRHRVGNELVWGYAPPQMDEISEARARQEGTK